MRKITLLLVTTMLYITSCTTGKYTASREYDDVYYSKADKAGQPVLVSNTSSEQNNNAKPDDYSTSQNGEKRESIGNDESANQRFDYNTPNDQTSNQQQPDYTSTQQQGGNTYVTNNYYNDDDYYDYAYSSRVRRFYHPCGWGYYDTYYTNSYMYDYNPYSWGVSIYLGYNWWQPHYMSASSWGITMGYGYPGYYSYDPWYNHYYGGYGYGAGYYQGYQNGYYNGLYNGSFNPYYFNSYDSYSYYYGPRGKGSSLNSSGGPRNIGQLYANNTTGHVNSQHINQASTGEQPFVKIKNNTQAESSTGGIKSMPDVRGSDNVPVKAGHDIKGDMENANPNHIKVPTDTKENQNNHNVDGAPVKNPSNIKVNHNVPVNSNPDIRNENNNNSGNDIRNIKSNPSDGIIKNPKQNSPIRNNPNDYSPSQPDNNPNGNIRTPRGDEPIRQNNNSAPVKSPKINEGSGNERSTEDHPSKGQVQYNDEQRNSKKAKEWQKQRSSQRGQENKPDNDTKSPERNPARNERNVNQQQSAPASQPRQSEQRNSNSNGNKIDSRPRH